MAAGDLVVRDGQYEFNGILFNDKAVGDSVRMTTTQGLFDLPDLKTNEVDTPEDHGGTVGKAVFAMRRIVLQFTVLATSRNLMYSKTRDVTAAFQPSDLLLPLVYQRPIIGKQFVNVKASKFTGFDSSYEKEMGSSPATALLVAPDPRKLSFVRSSQTVVIASGGTSNSGTANMGGNFVGGAKPVLEIAGPATNPRIANAADGNRSIKVDVVIPAGQTLIIDSDTRKVTLGGVEQAVRTDNQWWVLKPGNNVITYTRTDAPANTSTLMVRWWDSWA